MSDVGLFLSDDYSDEGFFNSDYDMDKEKKDAAAEKKIKVIKVIFWVLCIAILGEFVAYKYVMPCFSSPKVTFSGQKNMSAQEIATKLLPMETKNWINFDVAQAMSILSSEPTIENVVVEKHFPDKINVQIVEREPVAVTFVVEEGSTYPVQIDKNGVLFNVKRGFEIADLPIVSGLPFEYMSGGMRIPQKYRPLIEQINKIKTLPQDYFRSISEICVISKDSGNYELEIIPSQSKVKVLTDRTLNEEALKYMMVVLDVVNKMNADVSEVDLRYGSVSYRTK